MKLDAFTTVSVGRIACTLVMGALSASTLFSTLPAQAASDPAQVFHKAATQGNANPRVVPNSGGRYGDLAAQWWQWAFSFPLAQIPFFNTGGIVDVSEGQIGRVWFLAGANGGLLGPRMATVPTGVQIFLPMANLINDYPCPPQFGFEPNPGESIEHFLQRTANDFFPALADLFAEIDGEPLQNLQSYRAMSSLFTFTADPAVAQVLDPCVTGTPQPGVAVGYWLLLAPLPPGTHTLHFGSPAWGQDVTYVLDVKPRGK